MNKSRAMLFSAVLLTVAMGGTAMAGKLSFLYGGAGYHNAIRRFRQLPGVRPEHGRSGHVD